MIDFYWSEAKKRGIDQNDPSFQRGVISTVVKKGALSKKADTMARKKVEFSDVLEFAEFVEFAEPESVEPLEFSSQRNHSTE